MYNSKRAFLSFIPFIINAILLVIYGKDLKQFTNTPKIDFQIKGYDIDIITKLFTEYGEIGRAKYYFLTLIDIPFPFFVALFGVFYFGFTWKRWNIKPIWYILVTASIFFLIFDCIENYFIIRMLNNFPILNVPEIKLSSISTQIKLSSLFVIYTFTIITPMIQIIKWLKNKNTRPFFGC